MTQRSDIEANLLAQMIYNYAMIKYREGEYHEAQSYYNELLRCKESNNELLSYVPDYDIAYHLGLSSYHSDYYELSIDSLSTFVEEYHSYSKEGCKYDLSQVHLILAEMYELQTKNCNHFELSFYHYTKYIELKDQNLVLRLQNSEYEEGDVDSNIVEILPRLGELSFKAEHFLFAGNCLKEACNLMKS